MAPGRRRGSRGCSINPVAEGICGAIGVFLLGFTIYAGLSGTEAPDRNFALTFVFVTAWLGVVVLGVLFGNVFRAFNPWRAIGRVAGAAFRLVAGQEAPHARYPSGWAAGPPLSGWSRFVWLELVYGLSGFSTSRSRRRPVSRRRSSSTPR